MATTVATTTKTPFYKTFCSTFLPFYFTYFYFLSSSSSFSSAHDDEWEFSRNFHHRFVSRSVKLLGKFHGSCYAMKEKDNDEFQSIVRQLSKTRFEQTSTGNPVYDEMTKRSPKRGIEAVKNRYL